MSYKNRNKKMKNSLFLASALLAASLCGCSAGSAANPSADSGSNSSSAQNTSVETVDAASMFTDRDLDAGYDENSAVSIRLSDQATECDSASVTVDGNTVTITEEGTYLLSGELSEGQIVVNTDKTEKVQLVLDNASVTNSTSAAVYILQADKVFLTLAPDSKNTLSTTGEFEAIDENNIDAAVFSKEDLTINGSGSLNVSCSYGHGIVSKDDLVIAGGTYQITAASHTVSGKDSIRIADGTLDLSAGKDALHSDGIFYLADGTITVSTCQEGIEGQTIVMDGGSAAICASDDGLNASNASASASNDPFAADDSCTITINGGQLTITADGDGIDSNGSLLINGGEIYVAGPENDGNSALDYAGSGTINGGVFLATGYSGMAQNFGSSSTQGSILTALSGSSSETVRLLDADGNELLSFDPGRSYNCVVVSCPQITEDGTYTISAGSDSVSVTMSGLIYNSAGNGMNNGGMGGGMKNGDMGGSMGSGDMENGGRSRGGMRGGFPDGELPSGDMGTPPSGDSDSAPSGGMGTPPSGDSDSAPSGGMGTPPSGDSGSAPSGGMGTPPSGDSGSAPSGSSGSSSQPADSL